MRQRQLNSNIYTTEYYSNCCSSLDKNGKINKRFRRLFESINLDGKKILDLGCGKGDISILLGEMGANVIGIDYSRDGINMAKDSLLNGKKIKGSVKFYLMDAKRLKFNKNTFDIVISIDVFEHLYSEDLKIVIKKISRVLKKDGFLLTHTEANKIYLNFTHLFYVYPVSSLFIFLNKLLTGKKYPNLPRDPRNELHKTQHVNEPTYYYLANLFKRYKFAGKIIPVVAYKPFVSWKDFIYNIFVLFYPFSSFWPLHLLFAYDYICILSNEKIK